MDIDPLQPEQVEAAILANFIIDRWSDEVLQNAQTSAELGCAADSYTWRKVNTALRSCAVLLDAAMNGNFEYMADAAKAGYASALDDRGPETVSDVLSRIGEDLSVLYEGDMRKTNDALNAVAGVMNDSYLIMQADEVTPPVPQMNRAARRRAARGR
jgi:hypothetical protein